MLASWPALLAAHCFRLEDVCYLGVQTSEFQRPESSEKLARGVRMDSDSRIGLISESGRRSE
jgi:hypothetical protein